MPKNPSSNFLLNVVLLDKIDFWKKQREIFFLSKYEIGFFFFFL